MDNQGTVLLVTILFLIILSIIGISGIQRATTDLKITQNYKSYKKDFYLADGAAYEAVQKIDNGARSATEGWVRDLTNATVTLPDPDTLKSDSSSWPKNATSAEFSGEAEYIAYQNGSTFYVFGRSGSKDNEKLVEIGYNATD